MAALGAGWNWDWTFTVPIVVVVIIAVVYYFVTRESFGTTRGSVGMVREPFWTLPPNMFGLYAPLLGV